MKKTTCIITIIGTISITLNFFFLFLYIYPIIKEKYIQYKLNRIDNSENIVDLINTYNKDLLQAKESPDYYYPTNNPKENINKFFSNSPSAYQYGEYGWLIYLQLSNAIEKNDTSTISLIKGIFDKEIISTKIERADQAIYGCTSIMLYNHFKDLKYKYFADNIYKFLETTTQDDIILYRPIEDTQRVDVLGFVCPFLSLYKTITPNIKLNSQQQIENYIKYGVDYKTGMPCKGYTITNKIKVKHINWTRGWAWFGLALSFNKEPLQPNDSILINRFYNNVSQILKKEKKMPSFYPDINDCDMSSTLPLLFFCNKWERNTFSVQEIQSIIQKHCYQGQILPNLPSYSTGENGKYYQNHFLTQGMAIALLNQY